MAQSKEFADRRTRCVVVLALERKFGRSPLMESEIQRALSNLPLIDFMTTLKVERVQIQIASGSAADALLDYEAVYRKASHGCWDHPCKECD
jgi:hypothetical protein